MIHLFTRTAGKTAHLQLAILDALRAGEQVVEFKPGTIAAARLELDGFGGIRRVPLAPASADAHASRSSGLRHDKVDQKGLTR